MIFMVGKMAAFGAALGIGRKGGILHGISWHPDGYVCGISDFWGVLRLT